MSKGSKILLGILTFLPIIFGIACFVYYFSMMMNMALEMPSGEQPVLMHHYFARIFSMQYIMCILFGVTLHIGLMIYYIIHVVNHKVRSEGEKVMWILLFVFVGSIAYIIYFFIKIAPMPSKNEGARVV